MRILLVEPKKSMRERIKQWLLPHFPVRRVILTPDDESGLHICSAAHQDKAPMVAVMPLQPPLTRLYRVATPRSYIVASPPADSLYAKLSALNAGADLLLPKPWAPADLIATLRVAERRFLGETSPVFDCGPLTVDTITKTVYYNGEPFPPMPLRQFNLIRILAGRHNRFAAGPILFRLLAGRPFIRSNAVYTRDFYHNLIPETRRTMRESGFPVDLRVVKMDRGYATKGVVLQIDADLS